MNLLSVVLGSAVVLLLAYRVYGRWLARALRLDDTRPTPAVEMRDGLDFEPAEPRFLMGQHFSAIAAAGPVVGPILAGIMFGWGPALLWILVGSILIGGVHDFGALVASIRHRSRSIAEVVRDHISRRSYLLFLTFIWIALVYIIVAFTDITAASFVADSKLENGQVVKGSGIASASLMYLVLPICMGLLMRFAKLSLGVATLIFVPLVGLSIYAGQLFPLDVASLFGVDTLRAQHLWVGFILLYCLVAAVAPIWLLLQPRGHLGGVFLYAALALGGLGLLIGGKPIQYPAFTGWSTEKGETLFPFLFITIACGACSGFHSLIASGTTSKQLKRETDARAIGYGTMLLEAMVAVLSLSCVMILAQGSDLLKGTPNFIYATGIGGFIEVFGIPAAFAVSFALMAFTTFVYDTLDVCTRLGRYIIEELTGWKGLSGRAFATAMTAGVPVFFILQTSFDAAGKPIPAWRAYWPLFGACNQLLAALTLLGLTLWLWNTRRATWVLAAFGLPTVWMYTMSVWALSILIRNGFSGGQTAVAWVGVLLVILAALMLLEALRVFFARRSPPPAEGQLSPA